MLSNNNGIDSETFMTPNSSLSNVPVDCSQPVLHQHGQEIQSFGTIRNLPIALASTVRFESCRLLNQVLADSIILYSLYKKHHWLMRGNTFYQLVDTPLVRS
jgi:starvation-inducible DNA-binding protein